jgi:outer membrane protein W
MSGQRTSESSTDRTSCVIAESGPAAFSTVSAGVRMSTSSADPRLKGSRRPHLDVSERVQGGDEIAYVTEGFWVSSL